MNADPVQGSAPGAGECAPPALPASGAGVETVVVAAPKRLLDFCAACCLDVADLEQHEREKHPRVAAARGKKIARPDGTGTADAARANAAEAGAEPADLSSREPAPSVVSKTARASFDTKGARQSSRSTSSAVPDPSTESERQAAPVGGLAKREDGPELLRIEAVRNLLAACRTVDEALDVHSKTEAIAIYYRKRGASLEIQNDAAEARLEAERHLGTLLAAMKIRRGRKNPDDPVNINPDLDALGITYRQSSMWQRVAAIEEAQYAARVAAAKENGVELTTTRVLGLSRHSAAKADESAREDERPGRSFSFDAEVAAPVKALRRAVQRCPKSDLDRIAEQLRTVLERIGERIARGEA